MMTVHPASRDNNIAQLDLEGQQEQEQEQELETSVFREAIGFTLAFLILLGMMYLLSFLFQRHPLLSGILFIIMFCICGASEGRE